MTFPDSTLQLYHRSLPRPVGGGEGDAHLMTIGPDPQFMAAVMSVSCRIQRGAIPFRLEDNRCSYCLVCHQEPPNRCSRCQRVYYCDETCQQKHWKWHKNVCGTVTLQWNLELPTETPSTTTSSKTKKSKAPYNKSKASQKN